MASSASLEIYQNLHERRFSRYALLVPCGHANSDKGENHMKFCAIMTVIGFGAFFVFSVLALFAPDEAPEALTADVILAAIGFFVGIFAWLKVKRGTC